MSAKPDMRNFLALERTLLANERTFLAYVRTGLSLLGAAIVLYEFFAKKQSYEIFAALLAISGFCVLIIGLFRFFKVRKELKELG